MTIKLANSNVLRFLSIAVFLFTAVCFTSCEKEIKFNLNTGEEKLVVQGEIEDGGPPFVVLTKTMGFFEKIDLTALENAFIHDAVVTVSNGTKTITLVEYALDTGGTGAKFYVYTVDTSNLNNIMLGEFEKFYTLNIKYNNKEYTAQTKIPNVKGVDRMYRGEIAIPGGPNEPPADAVGLYIDVVDPDTTGNYIRYFTKRNDEQFYPVEVASAEKLGIGAQYLDSIAIGFGYDPSLPDSSDLIYPKIGDSVTLKWCSVDKYVYDFWDSYTFAVASVGNPFASPINLPTNISNGALGIWAGYGTSYISIKIE
jgi:hypothetical protein